MPERLVRLSGLQHQELNGEPYRFLLTNAIPKAVLEGKTENGYVVATYQVLADIPTPTGKLN